MKARRGFAIRKHLITLRHLLTHTSDHGYDKLVSS
jgi:CubicO group peptidase (beta-lactamase class C family)